MTAAAKKKPAKTATDLSHETIRTAALELIDQEGLEAFSTRKLGRVLGCEAMAIYWYYPSKDALLDDVVDKLMDGVGAAIEGKPIGDWNATMRGLAHAYRQVAHDHPKAFPLLATRRFASEGTFAFLDRLFELAREQGIDDKLAARFYRVISSYCNGFALNELAAPRGPQDLRTTALRRRFPHVEAVSEWLEPKYLDDIFTFGLELQLTALAQATKEKR
ncbi:MAG TPA: TetR/AcrR family transcriptional regulator C-terminal domain-containing protein [Kofleriaceae bacterium]